MEILPYLLLAALIAVIFQARRRGKDKLDAEFRSALRTLGVGRHELMVDRLTTPSTDRTAEVYRIVRDSQGRYFLYTKLGSSAGVLQPLSEERALLAIKISG